MRRRLRLAAFGVALLIITLATGLHLAGPATSPFRTLPGDDFLPSYMAGTFVRQGQYDLLTDFAAAETFQAQTRRDFGLQQHGRTGPWLNPPFYAWLFAPLSALPYTQALVIWAGLNFVLLGISLVLLYRTLPRDHRRLSDLAALTALLVFSMPAIQVLACQQNTFLSLAILSGVVTCWRMDRPMFAGLLAGLLCFKPQLAVIVWAALVCSMGWRALGGIALSAGLLIGGSLLLMPGAWHDYLTKLPTLIPSLKTDRPYFWERQTTFVGFWRLLLMGRAGGPNPPVVTALWALGALAVMALLARPAWRSLRGGLSKLQRDQFIATALVASPLLMPYYMDYDLLLLAIPAVLLASVRMTAGGGHRAGIAVFAVLYAMLFLNAAIGESTGVSLTVPLLVILLVAISGQVKFTSPRAVADTAAAPSHLALVRS